MSPFLPVNKRLLNEENYQNPQPTNTSLSEKDDISHTSRDDFIKKRNTKKQKTMTNTMRKLRDYKRVMKVLIIMKLQIP